MPVASLLKYRFNPQFNIDGYVLPVSPHDTYAAGKQNDVDLLVGTNASEGTFFIDAASVTVANFDAVLQLTSPSLLLWAVGASPGKTDNTARKAAVSIASPKNYKE